MYIEFKDSFHYHDGHLDRWLNAVDKLNDYIKKHPDEYVEVLFCKVVYLHDKHFSQTCILVRADKSKK